MDQQGESFLFTTPSKREEFFGGIKPVPPGVAFDTDHPLIFDTFVKDIHRVSQGWIYNNKGHKTVRIPRHGVGDAVIVRMVNDPDRIPTTLEIARPYQEFIDPFPGRM